MYTWIAPVVIAFHEEYCRGELILFGHDNWEIDLLLAIISVSCREEKFFFIKTKRQDAEQQVIIFVGRQINWWIESLY